MTEYTRKIPVAWDVDILIIGGGSAGSTAAIAAGRTGVKVGLIERYGFLGGTGTQVLDTFYGFYTPGETNRKVVGGIPDEVVERLESFNAAIKRPNSYGAGTGITYNPEILKVVWEELVRDAGVQILYHTFVVDVFMEEETVIGVVIANKAGLSLAKAKIIIDATGDADVAAKAGVPFEGIGSNEKIQSLTTTFRINNVNVEKARNVSKQELWQQMKEANRSGNFRLPREEGSVHITPLPGVMATNMVRISIQDPTDPFQLTNAEIEGRKQAMEYFRFLKERIPGYENASLGSFSTQIGVRETRRIKGEYQLTREDVLQAKRFYDEIALCGAPIEDHHEGTNTRWEYIPNSGVYGIPYRTLIPVNVGNVIVVGRSLSASHDAHASVRSMAQCMATGQAAGIAAALAIESGKKVREVEISTLRKKLIDLGAILES